MLKKKNTIFAKQHGEVHIEIQPIRYQPFNPHKKTHSTEVELIWPRSAQYICV